MPWRQSNDKHIYAKNGIDNRHIHVTLGLNALTYLKIEDDKYVDWVLLYC